jgi:hypothetical protein
VETEGVDLKAFKPIGRFYEDIDTLTKMLNLKVHPALKPTVYAAPDGT